MAETAIEEALARKIAQLQPTSPEIIRAAPAYRALQRFGAALRPKSNFLNANSTYLSQPTTRINAFWSHSWHGGTTRKICTLLMLHNSGPAALLSVLAALLAAWAFGFGLLPELVHPYLVWWIPRALWPFITGMVVFWMTLLLWQPRDSIFLDSLCIDQIDMHAKAQGLFSMGAFLKCSKKLLVLWDPTYTRRLWCMFELSAFLYSRPSASPSQILIRPTWLGPCYLLVALSCTCITATYLALPETAQGHVYWLIAIQSVLVYPAAAKLREYFRSLETLKQELQCFQFESTTCHCCSIGHVTGAGIPIICDRHVLQRCIALWFGSTANFEKRIRFQVLNCLLQQLSCELFSYTQCIIAAVPISWGFIDAAGAELRNGHYDGALREMLRGVSWWLGVIPGTVLLILRLAYHLRAIRRCSFLANASIAACVAAYFGVWWNVETQYIGLHGLLGGTKEYRARASGWLAATSLLNASLLFRCLGAHPRYVGVHPADEPATFEAHSLQDGVDEGLAAKPTAAGVPAEPEPRLRVSL